MDTNVMDVSTLSYIISSGGIEEKEEINSEIKIITDNFGEVDTTNLVPDVNPNLNSEIIFSLDGTLSVRNITGTIDSIILSWNEEITDEDNIDITFFRSKVGPRILNKGFTHFKKKNFYFNYPIVIDVEDNPYDNLNVFKNYYIVQNVDIDLNNELTNLFKINNNLNQNLTINSSLTEIKTKEGNIYKITPTSPSDIKLYYTTTH
tara:strand:+ start:86 stop:700 length:615 start_codon:yes stop_codon:yes gene_type:complete